MNREYWKFGAEIVGISAIVASLVFVGLELRHSQQVARADRQFQQIERELELSDLIERNVDLIVKLNDGENLTPADEILADRLVRSLWTVHFYSFTQIEMLNAPGGSASIRSLVTVLHDNPGLLDRYRNQVSRLDANISTISGRGFTGAAKDFHDRVAEFLSRLENVAN